jgi:hypothetical protein
METLYRFEHDSGLGLFFCDKQLESYQKDIYKQIENRLDTIFANVLAPQFDPVLSSVFTIQHYFAFVDIDIIKTKFTPSLVLQMYSINIYLYEIHVESSIKSDVQAMYHKDRLINKKKLNINEVFFGI